MALKSRLKCFGDIQWVQETGSTNTDLVKQVKAQPALAMMGLNQPLATLRGAHQQTNGRGRAGRAWVAAEGESLLFSCAFEIKRSIADLGGLSPAIGVATCEALRALLSALLLDKHRSSTEGPVAETTKLSRLTLKWPNDIQCGEAKLAGILIESAATPPTVISPPTPDPATKTDLKTDSTSVVIGIGLNLYNGAGLSAHLDREVTDWATISGVQCDPVLLVAKIAQAWFDAVQIFSAAGFTPFRARFDTVDALAGQTVNTYDQGRLLITGIAQGVDTQGQLLVKTEAGTTPVFVGDVSVRRQPSFSSNHNQ